MKWQPRDIIACLIIVCCFVLLFMGRDTVVSWSLLAVVAAYYGINLTPLFTIGKKQKKGD